jgi:phosphatidylglycerophosphatase A
MNRLRDKIVLFIAQGAYSGRFPVAPGTAGTVVGVLFYLFLKNMNPFWYGAACVGVTVLGTWAAGYADCILGTKDSPSIVIDEIAGFLVAMFLIPFVWGYIIAGFILFRFFDILKPWPLKKLQDISGGPGVMLDDIGAGVYTNVILQVAGLILNQ